MSAAPRAAEKHSVTGEARWDGIAGLLLMIQAPARAAAETFDTTVVCFT